MDSEFSLFSRDRSTFVCSQGMPGNPGRIGDAGPKGEKVVTQ